MKKEAIVKNISTKELTKAVFYTQFLLLVISGMFYILFLRDWEKIKGFIRFDWGEIVYYGVLFALLLVVVEIILYYLVPKKYLDDGGINEKLFKNQSVLMIFLIALTVAIAEELLFRGMIQTVFGYIFASSLFVLIHTRYLKKPILLIFIILTSFLIGYLFKVTNNLLVTIAFHFVVDFCLGLFIKYKR